jgi:hypothetical protein
MGFDDWYASQSHWISHESFCRAGWDAAARYEREALVGIIEAALLPDDAEGAGAHNAALEAVKLAMINR